MSEALRTSLQPELLPWLVGLLVIVIAAAAAEGIVLGRRGTQRYDWRAFAASLADAFGRRVVDTLGFSLTAPLLAWAHAHRLTTLALNDVAAFALLFVGQEFCYYGYHRAAHRVRWFWATHAVHHSSNELTLASALRLGWTGKASGTALFFTPLVWLGFAPQLVLASVALNLLYQFWLHTTWIPKLGALEWVLNTPSHHRVHHGSNPEYLDCNYGGVLIVFDRLFGTFVEERADLPPRYGLVTPLRTHNPIHIALHEWLSLARDLRAAVGWRARAALLFAPPRGGGQSGLGQSAPATESSA
jgi:sterol desaturase/sphingolipid hydroxylase (fatty acid hydroxylase superfamily)